MNLLKVPVPAACVSGFGRSYPEQRNPGVPRASKGADFHPASSDFDFIRHATGVLSDRI